MPVKLPHELSRDVLLAIVAGVQGRMYLDMNREGREFWNPAKAWSGADVCMDVQDVLHHYGLVPGEEEDYVPPPDAAPDLSGNVQPRVPRAATGAESGTAGLVAWASAQGLSSEDLDEAVHDAIGGLASSVNNEGMDAQIKFLVQRFGAVETRKLLGGCLGDKP